MSKSCWGPSLRMRFSAVSIVIFQSLAYLSLPIVYSSFNSPRDYSDLTSERTSLVSLEASSGREQPLTEEPTHLSLGSGLYLIGDRRGSEEGVGSYLGRRKRVEGNEKRLVESARYQGRAEKPLDWTYINERDRKQILANRGLCMDARPRKSVALPRTYNRDQDLPDYLAKYFKSTEEPRDGANRSLVGRMLAIKTTTNRMSDYNSLRHEYVVLPRGNQNRERRRLIVKANDHLGSKEIHDLYLETEELNLAKDLLPMKNLGDFSSWKPLSFYSAIVDSIRSIRATLYRIRTLDDMCQPPLFATLEARQNAQKAAFELLRDFWRNHIFKAIADQEARDIIFEVKPGKVKEIMLSALAKISIRDGQASAEKTALGWVTFLYWAEKDLLKISPDLCQKIGLFTTTDQVVWEMLSSIFKMYHADQAVGEASEFKMIQSSYLITRTAQFKLSHKMGVPAVAPDVSSQKLQ